MKIALLQISPRGTLEENRQKGVEACRKAKEMEADIALFPEMWSNGYRICDRPSQAWIGEAYLPGLDGSRDTCVLQAGGEEGVFLATLDVEQLRAYRREEVHGNAYRRPEKYHLLVDQKIQEPFVRPDRRM